jgi:molecular chaperone DnaK
VVSLEEFIDGLTVSRLLTEAELRTILVSLPPEMQPPTMKQLAAELVRRGRLTRYQAGCIASGRPKGLVLGKYVIQDKIGEGGMGQVFVAEHRRMKRPVVVKILPAAATESERSIRRFQREVEAAAQLHHPNIVTAFDADEQDGIHFLVMEYVEGHPLGELVAREGPLPLEKAITCAIQAAQGLEYAHSKGIVHRDIKPGNLLLDHAGVVKILDMGLARFDDGRATVSSEGESLTQQNQIVGTVEYMSPEQVDNSSTVDGRSDIYSLGCTLFRLLTDRPPYQSDSVVKILLAHRLEPIPSLAHERPDAPARLDQILQRMMAKNPEERYQTATELIGDLQACLAEVRTHAPAAAPRIHPEGTPCGEKETSVLDMEIHADVRTARHRGGEATVGGRKSEDTLVLADAAATRQPAAAVSPPAVGIDLGTTFSVIAVLDDVGRPQVLANQEGDKLTPSVVLWDENDVVVGKEAVKAMATDMERVAECAKRDLGFPRFHAKVGGQEYPPEVIQAWVLAKLRSDARSQIGVFRQVVITVPAYFDEVRRKATQDAGYMAGLEVLDIINEPTAAALAFGFQHGSLNLETGAEAKRVMVYDLGGGTFDLTIMEIAGGEFVTLATDGDVRLGGRDWDQRLVDHVAEIVRQQHGRDPREDPNASGRLLRECEDAKRTLSARQRAHVSCDYGGHSARIEVSRDRFEELTVDLLERTSFTTRQTLLAAGLQWSDIDHLLLVGGATRMPAVVRMLQRISGKVPDTSLAADEAVAQGAALYAGVLLETRAGREPRVRIRNVNSHSLGVVATDRRTERKQTAVLIPRNTPLPAKAKRVFKTLRAGQRTIVATIVEGESTDPAECTQIGKCSVNDLPPDLPSGTPIEVRFQYEQNGRLQVTVHVRGLEQNVTQEIRRENNMSAADLERWRQTIEHPGL